MLQKIDKGLTPATPAPASTDLEIAREPSNELIDLMERERAISEASKSFNTRKGYKSDFNSFSKWCAETDLSHLPAHPDTVRLYLVFLDKIGRKPSTIKRCITSIRIAHTMAGYPNPITDSVNQTASGIYRLRGVAPEKKSALTLERLARICSYIPNDILGIRDRAMILVGWMGALRRSEITAIAIEDIEEEAEGLVINVRRSKIDQFGAGKRIGLPFLDDHQELCASRALTKWVSIARIKAGPVFRYIGKSGRNRILPTYISENGLNAVQVSTAVKRYAELAGYNPLDFGGHSLRSGLATTLAGAGIEERKIMQITGHRSLPMLREYIQRGELFLEHPILTLFSRK